MTTVSESQIIMYKQVNVMRDFLPLARVFYDLHVDGDGIAGYAVWQTNTFRIPILYHISDYRLRKKRADTERSEVVGEDERNFFFTYHDIQGIVTHSDHKELQILTNSEQLSIHFRWPEEYEGFVTHLKEKISDKIFSRDDVEVKASIYIS